jgi:hypothetical protein
MIVSCELIVRNMNAIANSFEIILENLLFKLEFF